MNKEEFENDLGHFTGTFQYHKLTMFPLLATDGVAYFADKAEAFWLINDIACVLQTKLKNEAFVVIKAKSENNKAIVEYTDGDYNHLYKQEYDYTDLIPGEWKVFTYNNVIMLPSEY